MSSIDQFVSGVFYPKKRIHTKRNDLETKHQMYREMFKILTKIIKVIYLDM